MSQEIDFLAVQQVFKRFVSQPGFLYSVRSAADKKTEPDLEHYLS